MGEETVKGSFGPSAPPSESITGRTHNTSANPSPNQQVMCAVSSLKKKRRSLQRCLRYTDLGSADKTDRMTVAASSGPFKNWNFGLPVSGTHSSTWEEFRLTTAFKGV